MRSEAVFGLLIAGAVALALLGRRPDEPTPPAPAPGPMPAPRPEPARPALVARLYSTRWCPHCRAFAPVWASWRERHARAGLEFHETDCDADRDSAAAAGIDALPSVILHREGAEIRRWKGGPPEEEFLRAIAPVPGGAGVLGCRTRTAGIVRATTSLRAPLWHPASRGARCTTP